MTTEQNPTPVPAETKTVRLRHFAWDDTTVIEVGLRLAPHFDDRWEVLFNDEVLGTVEKYEGSIDRPISRGSRIRDAGKRRTLWASTAAGSRYTMWEHVSRADAIRDLLPSNASTR